MNTPKVPTEVDATNPDNADGEELELEIDLPIDLPLDPPEVFFEGPVHELWNRIVPADLTKAEVEFLAGVFTSGKAKPRLVDIASGAGRHALGLAAEGFAVTALDLAASELAHITKVATAKKLDVRTVQHDMRELASWEVPKPFDGAYCFGNALAYLSPDELLAMLTALAERLKPGAPIVLETGMVAESVLASFEDRIELQAGDLHLTIDNDYDIANSRVLGHYVFTDAAGAVTTRRFGHWCLTARELLGILDDAGYEVVELLESVDGEGYGLGSPRMILLAKRR